MSKSKPVILQQLLKSSSEQIPLTAASVAVASAVTESASEAASAASVSSSSITTTVAANLDPDLQNLSVVASGSISNKTCFFFCLSYFLHFVF